MTNKLLIANRGEIALRVMRTADALGRPTVALFTELDAQAPHRDAAVEAVLVPNYLDIDAIVAAAKATGATQIHPGYGFLSERPEFAQAVAEAGLTLVGPSADVMEKMGRKDAAREIAMAAGVPVVPSYAVTGVAEPRPEAVAGAPSSTNVESMVFPVLVKAAAGGGGKGMRVVHSADELPEAMAAAARESAKAFGDDTLLIEKYVESGRHIEVQVFGDTHGGVVHLFERDCSTQRRHQKVLEEAPAPTISAEQREAITTAAVALARAVGYVGAGTVEFLLDNATGEFYFLEMNTRLQVEHPVTEEVVRVRGERIDLVGLQLRVADGEPLGFEQSEVTLDGHAIEARIYAEDSFNGFLPQAGRAGLVQWPDRIATPGGHPHVRVDHALASGQEVSTSYDPMLGKVIAWGETRDEARNTLRHALDHTTIFGLTTNAGFARALIETPEFRDATIDTAWLDRHDVAPPSEHTARVLAAMMLAGDPAQRVESHDPWQADGFRLSADAAPTLVQLDELVAVKPDRVGDCEVRYLGGLALRQGFGAISAIVDGVHLDATAAEHGEVIEVVMQGQRFVFTRPDPFDLGAAAAGDGELSAPMPGAVLQVSVAVGDQVTEGQALAIMEAMKMELTLKAPFDGVVSSVDVAVGDQVALGATLLRVEASGDHA